MSLFQLIFDSATRVEDGEYRCFLDSINENDQSSKVVVHSVVKMENPIEPEPNVLESMILPISLLSISIMILSLVLYIIKAFI